MENNLNERQQKSLNLINHIKNTAPKNPNCKVEYFVDGVGAISARVYGEKSIAYSELCYNDGISGKKGLYMLRSAFLNPKEIIDVYATHIAKVPSSTVKMNSDAFVKWLEHLCKTNALWESTQVAWRGGFTEVYETIDGAMSALQNGEVLRLDPYNKKQQIQTIDDGRTM